jgi:hypothetical protein
MLGEILIEGDWKITGVRDLAEKRKEISFLESGKVLGVEFSSQATVISVERPDCSIYAERNATLTTKDGETVTWTGMGIGHPKGQGAVQWRVAKAFETSSQKLVRITKAPLVFEAESDENGIGWHKHWKWK